MQSHYLHPIRRRLRELGGSQKGFTLEWLAKRAGVTTSTLRYYMRGECELGLWNKSKVLKALNIPESYLYGIGEYARKVG